MQIMFVISFIITFISIFDMKNSYHKSAKFPNFSRGLAAAKNSPLDSVSFQETFSLHIVKSSEYFNATLIILYLAGEKRYSEDTFDEFIPLEGE